MKREIREQFNAAACATRARLVGLGVTLTLAVLPQILSAEITNLPPVLPPPEFMANKTPQPDLLLKDKRKGSYFTGFPAIGWDPESGFNYGASVQWFDNGPADSPFLTSTGSPARPIAF